ncbi:MAG: hypothetical protein JKY65_24750 [Planctomycetes bacterium]|nr:hypothetical protein [Planctomycetota bacterium]
MRTLTLTCLLSLLLALPSFGQSIDLSKLIQAPGYLPLGKSAKVGFRYERTTTVGGQESREFMAIVGETKDTWEIESTQGLSGYGSLPSGKDIVLALVVDKKTHKVLIARLGKVGGELKEVKVMKMPPLKGSVDPKKPDRLESVKLPGGKEIEAEVHVTEVAGKTYTTWVGKKGSDLEGILIKHSGQEDYGLTKDPAPETLELEDKDDQGKPVTIEAVRTSYSNGYSYSTTKNEIAVAFNVQAVRLESKQFSMAVVSLRKDAKKTLTWK